MALDPDRTRARCKWKDCPFDAKVIDLTAGGFVEQADGDVYHAACYAAKQGQRAETAARRAARDADAALDAEVAAVRQKRADDAAAAAAAEQARLSGQVPTGAAVAGTPTAPTAPAPAQGASGTAPLVTSSTAQPAIPG